MSRMQQVNLLASIEQNSNSTTARSDTSRGYWLGERHYYMLLHIDQQDSVAHFNDHTFARNPHRATTYDQNIKTKLSAHIFCWVAYNKHTAEEYDIISSRKYFGVTFMCVKNEERILWYYIGIFIRNRNRNTSSMATSFLQAIKCSVIRRGRNLLVFKCANEIFY